MADIEENQPEEIIEALINGERRQVTPSFVVSKYGQDAPTVIFEAHQFGALIAVDSVHAGMLRRLSGNRSIEEMLTWPRKKAWADAFLATGDEAAGAKLIGLLTKAERGALGNNAAAYMAQAIAAESEGVDGLIVAAEGIRRETRASIKAATRPSELAAALDAAQVLAAQAMQAFLQARG